MLKQCLFILPVFMLCSCSFIQQTTYFDSGNGSNWQGKTLNEKLLVIHTERSVISDELSQQIGSITLKPYYVKPLFFGPPLVPLMPLFLFGISHYSRSFSIRGEISALNIQQMDSILDDSTGTIIINEQIRLPVSISPSYNRLQGTDQVFETVRHIIIRCNYPAKKVRSFRIIPLSQPLARAFARTTFRRRRKLIYSPFFFEMR